MLGITYRSNYNSYNKKHHRVFYLEISLDVCMDMFEEDNKFRTYNPDFLVEKTDGTIELVEMKGEHLLKSPNTKRKMEFAKKWCDARDIKYRLISKYQ